MSLVVDHPCIVPAEQLGLCFTHHRPNIRQAKRCQRGSWKSIVPGLAGEESNFHSLCLCWWSKQSGSVPDGRWRSSSPRSHAFRTSSGSTFCAESAVSELVDIAVILHNGVDNFRSVELWELTGIVFQHVSHGHFGLRVGEVATGVAKNAGKRDFNKCHECNSWKEAAMFRLGSSERLSTPEPPPTCAASPSSASASASDEPN